MKKCVISYTHFSGLYGVTIMVLFLKHMMGGMNKEFAIMISWRFLPNGPIWHNIYIFRGNRVCMAAETKLISMQGEVLEVRML